MEIKNETYQDVPKESDKNRKTKQGNTAQIETMQKDEPKITIEVERLSKKFGNQVVLNEVSLGVKNGSIVGIIGRNGSGKTVLFKCICGFMKADSGTIRVNEKRIGKDIDILRNAGIIIETPGFLPNLSGYHNLMLLADINHKITKKEIREVLNKVGLDPDSKVSVKHYSLGMKQRLAIAQAFMEGQEILILDEPMNGLDNHGVEEIRTLLLALKAEGKTILLTSHNREDIEYLCDEKYQMDRGVLTKV